MLLAAIDIGNSRLHVGLFARLPDGIRLIRMDSQLGRWPVAEACYASVDPARNRAIEAAARKMWGVKLARMGRDFPAAIRNRTKKPAQTGFDRLANAVAAWHRYKRACIVADLGTAVTLDVVDARGHFRGGSISPGVRTQAWSLHDCTANLPLTKIRGAARIGRTTGEAIEAGVTWGLRGLLDQGYRAISKELRTRPRFIGTGGDASRFLGMFDAVVPELTLEGIALSYLAHE